MSTDNIHPDHTGAGFVPRLGADPSAARYELLTAAQAVERVTAVGFDRADAQVMVDQYLAQNTAAVGAPSGDGWRVDPHDLAEIARAYDWVDHYQGETIADARVRAAQYAAEYQHRADAVDREQDPRYAARVDREATEWADRARDGHTPWPVPDRDFTSTDEESDLRTPEQAARSGLVSAASWAIAARDSAIEHGNTEHAARFARQAREALAAADAAGITREQLAAELDYPCGAAELDGEHVDLSVTSGAALTAADLAGWDAAWDEAMAATSPRLDHTRSRRNGEWDGDGDEGAGGDGGVRGPADPGPLPLAPCDGADAHHAADDAGREDLTGGPGETRDGDWVHDGAGVDEDPAAVAEWEPVDPEFTLPRDEVVTELTHRGMSTDQATAAVTRYLDDTSREIGVPVHRWGMDSHDVEAITHTHAAVLTGRPVSDPWVQAAGPDLTAAMQVGSGREDGGPISDGRGPALSGLPGVPPDSVVRRPDLDATAAERRVAAARDAVTQATTPARTSQQAEGDTEQDRRSQLATWAHDDDTNTNGAEHGMELQR
jgi:hypothetical protein